MATQHTTPSPFRNGSKRVKPVISDSEVSRLVDNFQPRASGGFTKSKIEVCFNVKAVEATAVSVAGSFNNWDPRRTPLQKKGDAWEATVALARGRYEYRFIVDGKWISDPSALESIANPYGSRNSVLSV